MSRYRPSDQARRASDTAIPHGWSAPAPERRVLGLADFEAVVGTVYDENRDAWETVMKALNLRLCYQPAVAEVLGQARWRTARNPRAYIATAAYRRALSMELPYWIDRVVEPDGTVRRFRTVPSSAPYSTDPGYGEDDAGNRVTEDEHRSWVTFSDPVNRTSYDPFLANSVEMMGRNHIDWERRRDSGTPTNSESDQASDRTFRVTDKILVNNSWRAAAAIDDDDGGDWLNRIPDWLRFDPAGPKRDLPGPEYAGRRLGIDPTSLINWPKVAEVAVMKRYMRRFVAKSLHLRFDELIGRDEAVSRERRPEDKLAMSAAYQWVSRNWEGRIRTVLRADSEDQARTALYGARVPKRREEYLKASAALDRALRRDPYKREDCPRELLFKVKYGQ
jgi:hypothetical protein